MTQQSGAGSPQQFCLRWNNYQTNLTNVFDQLLQSESFVDVTLACDGHSVKAHKMVLSACSPYFQALFFENPCHHPIVIMKDIKWPELKAAVEFMYKGEINVSQEQIGPLLKVAECLKIRGLADVNNEHELTSKPMQDAISSSSSTGSSVHRKKRRRASGERSPSVDNNSPDHNSCMTEDQDGSAVMSEVQNLVASSTPRSLGSPNMPSISVTPQINLQELPVSLAIPPPPPPPVSQSSHPVPHHVPVHVTSSGHPSVNHLGAHVAQLSVQQQHAVVAQQQAQQAHQQAQQHQQSVSSQSSIVTDDLEIKPGIAEMIREEERAKLLESSHAWLGASTSNISDSYQYQLQSLWQKCWNTNSGLVHNLRFRERGPLKSWRPETMAEAIFSVLKEGLSLSQAARKYDIPYPTFVLYANRVHNMLGPSTDGGADLRPKGRGRPQRILLGVWPDEHIRGVIRAVVFRDGSIVKDEPTPIYPSLASYACNGPEGAVSPSAAAAAAVAAVAQGLRHQMCNMVAAAQSHQHDMVATNLSTNFQTAVQVNQLHLNNNSNPSNNNSSSNNRNSPLMLGLPSPGSGGPPESPMEGSPLASPLAPLMDPAHIPNSVEVGIGIGGIGGIGGMTYKPQRSYVSPRPENIFQEDIADLVKSPHGHRDKDKVPVKLEPLTDSRSEQ
ncbi:protein bric-a-brac 1-like isoform X2 [Chelonus insularis]|uniref:protein bric-a-brac 1-like isoform X2 n=1 Tax=Chelonus insularis TaxID=460826 RepID=UPI00158F4389|nr:protein bric-a-brac 1-like isoform X2 [Chelonus insularis]